MMKKKGELTTQQLVGLIILITSFAILLFLLFRLNLTDTTQKELCYNSVIMKGGSILPGESIPLNCKRSYVCLSSDNTCEKMTKPRMKKVKTKEEVYQVLADEMADCWWMFGEGKVNYVQKDVLPELYCSLCSQVAFDDSISEIFESNEIDKKEFYSFLTKEKISSKDITYSQFLYKTNDVDKIYDGDFGKINLDNQYYVMMGITSKVSKLGWAGIGAVTAVGVAFFSIPAGIIAGTVVMVGGIAGTEYNPYVGTVVEGASGNDYLSPTIVEIGSEEYKALKCESIETLS